MTSSEVSRGKTISENLARALITDPLLAEEIPLPPEPPGYGSSRDPLAGMIDADTLNQTEYEPLQWVVPGIVPEGLTMLVAPPKAGKSWLVAGLGIACASGGVAFSKIKVDRRPVLYLALEDGWRRLQTRFRQINPGSFQPKSLDLIIDAVGQLDVELKMATWLQQHKGEAGLIILDTLGRIKPPKQPGEESYLADYAVGVRLKTIIDQDPGSSLLVVHHTRKQASDDFVDGVSGTQGLAGSFDSVLVLARRRQANDAVLHVTGRDVEEGEYALQTDAGVWSLIGDSLDAAAEVARASREAGQLGEALLDVLAVVKDAPGATTPAEVAQLAGIDAKTASKYLSRLVERGDIVKPARGKYVSSLSKVSTTESDFDSVDTLDIDPQGRGVVE